MRPLPALALLLLAGACATNPPPRRGPPPGGFRGPPDGGERGWLFISPMGEPFRVEHPEQAWFAGADTDHDGAITRAEFEADAARFFNVLDREHDGEIDPGDIDFYENRLAPEIRVGGGAGAGRPAAGSGGGGGRRGGRGGGGRGPGGGGGMGGPGGGGGIGGGGRGPGGGGEGGGSGERGGAPGARADAQGAARYGYLALPEPVVAADRDFNRGIDPVEFRQAADERFALLDKNGDGRLTPGELPRIDTRARGSAGGPPPGARGDRPRRAGKDDDDGPPGHDPGVGAD